MKNDELIRHFDRGGESGSASRMEITQAPDGATFLWDYGWALIAYRSPDRVLYCYDGWEGYSSTTSKHVRYFKLGDHSYAVANADHYVDAQPKIPRGLGVTEFDPDGRVELEDYSYDQIHP